MRLDDLLDNNKIDKQKILADLNKYFTCFGEITIDDQTGKLVMSFVVTTRPIWAC